MNKKILIVLLFLLLVLPSCKKKETIDVQDINNEEIAYKSISETDDGYEIIINYLNKFYSYSSFKAEQTGNVTSKVLFFNYEQVITASTERKDGIIKYHNNSSSSLVTTNVTATFNNNMVNCIDQGEESNLTKDEYRKKYGVTPDDGSLLGFIITRDAILDFKKELLEDGNYQLIIKLDGNLSGTNNKIQKKYFGDLNDYPNYEEVIITLITNNDYLPIKSIIDAKYQISKNVIGNLNCIEHLEELYNVN